MLRYRTDASPTPSVREELIDEHRLGFLVEERSVYREPITPIAFATCLLPVGAEVDSGDFEEMVRNVRVRGIEIVSPDDRDVRLGRFRDEVFESPRRVVSATARRPSLWWCHSRTLREASPDGIDRFPVADRSSLLSLAGSLRRAAFVCQLMTF